jgi:glucose/arabinose dehydrogenase
MTEATVLLRQVHPTFIQQGRVTSQAFRPTTKDDGQLSVYDGDLIQPPAAWDHYTGTLGFASDGVLGITVGEVGTESLPATPDPDYFAEHAIVDFREFNSREIEKKSKRLKVFAVGRGWLYMTDNA